MCCLCSCSAVKLKDIDICIYGGCEQSSVSSVIPDICVSLSNKTKPKRGFLNGELPVYLFKICWFPPNVLNRA